MVGDGVGWIEIIFGREPPQELVYLGVFIIFAIIVVIRLVKLQTQIDASRERVRLFASPGFLAINHPMASEQPLSRDEVSINTTIYFEVWTDIDINTAHLVLNVVGIRRRRWWKLLAPTSKRMIGIRIESHDDSTYRKQIKRTDAQPFQDHATFKWRGKREVVDWGDTFLLELALEMGSPSGVWQAIVDPNLYERGATTAL